MALRIEDYALIGDTQTAGLVGKDGSIDWMCFPRFDSGACFAALLGDRSHGHWRLGPVGEIRSVKRRYLPDTLVLETVMTTDSGTVRLLDCMPPRNSVPDVVRVIECVRGSVEIEHVLCARFDYGSTEPWLRHDHNDRGGYTAVAGPDALTLHTELEHHSKNNNWVARFTLREGEQQSFHLLWHESHLQAEHVPEEGLEAIAQTQTWWREWTGRCSNHASPWEDAIRRSAITLKALTYAPTGGIVAAATTSLPEGIGGVRNWDYRFCWLRDATFTLYALMMAGYQDEAAAWRDWLLRAVAGNPEQLQIMYGVGGERRLHEVELPWLPGYEGSAPVRVGNGAYDQFQLDVFGEVIDALHQARRGGLETDPSAWKLELGMMDYLESAWAKPDEGIWEVRGPRRHFTHSKMMAWVAVDRAIRGIEQFKLEGPLEKWKALRARIHAEVCERGYDASANAFTQSYDSKSLDASLLMMPLLGFLPATDSRVVGTVAAIEKKLLWDGLVLRYQTDDCNVDGLPGKEGVFLLCTFWLADCYAMMGRKDEARALFERLLSLRNDVGLLAEQYDPDAKRMLGNFPQAFSHVGLINTAMNLLKHQDGPAQLRPAS